MKYLAVIAVAALAIPSMALAQATMQPIPNPPEGGHSHHMSGHHHHGGGGHHHHGGAHHHHGGGHHKHPRG
jgi:hypothetical protein